MNFKNSAFQERVLPERNTKIRPTGGLNSQQPFDARVFRLIDDHGAAQMTLLFFRFRARDVAEPGAITLYFTCASHLETLLGAGVGFHLRHNKNDVC